MNFTINKIECVIYNRVEEVSDAFQHQMNDSGETRVGHKPDFRVKSPLIVDKVEICLMETSHVLPTDKKKFVNTGR